MPSYACWAQVVPIEIFSLWGATMALWGLPLVRLSSVSVTVLPQCIHKTSAR